MAFSASSASRWTTSLTAWPRTAMPGWTLRVTRSYCSISETAARSTSTSGDRLVPPPGRVVAGEDQQVLRVAAHAGGEVVHLEQAGQPVRVLLALLQIVDQPDLPLDQRLAAAGQVDEHGVDVAAQRGLVGGQPQRLAVNLVEGPRDFTDLVRGVDVDRLDVQRDAGSVGLAHPADRLRQPDAGDLQRARPQAAQRPDHRPADDGGEQQREQQHDQYRGADDAGRR